MKSKRLLVLSTLFLSLGLSSCGENFPSHIKLEDGDNGEIVTPYRPYDNGKRIESISVSENDVSLDITEKSEYQIEASFEPKDAFNPELTYTSNNEDIALVDEDGKVVLLAPGSAVITVSSDNGVTTDFRITGIKPATAISIVPHFEDGGIPLDINDSKQFSIVTEPADATKEVVSWSVTDENGLPTELATISETGLLSVENAKKADNVKLVVHADSVNNPLLSASELIIVDDARIYADSLSIEKDGAAIDNVDVYLNEPVQLDAVTVPEITTAEKVNWASEDTSIATVDEGLIEAVKAPFETKVKAAVDGLVSEVTVNTKKIDVTGISLDHTSLVLNKGDEQQLTATIAPSNASVKDVIYSIKEGGNQYISVDENGLVKANYPSGEAEATVVASSKDNSEIFAECTVKVTNKVTSIDIINSYDKMYNGGQTYTLELNAVPFDCDDFDVTWESNHPEIAAINDGVITTNNNSLTGLVTFTAKVNGTEISDFIDINIIKQAEPFTAGKMYLIGNRNFQSSVLDYDHPSWDDSDYALEMVSMPVDEYKNQWALTDFHFERYNTETGEGDLFKFRSDVWPEFTLDPASTKSCYLYQDADGNSNLAVSNSEKYDMYFKEAFDGTFSLYIMSEFNSASMYVAGSRDFSSGTASGSETSWNDVSKAYVMEYNQAKGEYHAAVTFDEGDEFKVRRDEFLGLVVSQDEYTASIAHQDETTGNAVVDVAGQYDIYFKSELGVWTIYMHEYVEPTPFAWGIAGSKSGWELDSAHKFVESTPEGTALYTYKTEYSFDVGDTWKVTNTNGEWVNNIEGQVGIDYEKSTYGAFECFEGNIKVKTAGDYDITLNIYDGAEKDAGGANFINGVQIIAVKQEGPGPSPVDPTSVSIDQTGPITVKNGKSTTLSATLAPEDATGTLIWSSNNESVISVNSSTGEVTAHADSGSATITVTVKNFESLTDTITVNAAKDVFGWGVAGDPSDWKLDEDKLFVESAKEGDAIYTYKGEYTFEVGDEWKVTNTNGEWVNNEEGVVGLDYVASTYGAFEPSNGNIKVKTAGTYNITLNIFKDASKVGNDFVNGIQIIAIKQEGPVEPSISFGIANPKVVEGENLEIPVTAVNCSELTYICLEGDSYVEIVQASCTDSKLVVHGANEGGSATIKALAGDGLTEKTIEVECVAEPPVPLEGYYVSINGTPTFELEENDKGEYIIAVAKLNEGDQIQIYDAEYETTFHANLDDFSISGFEDKDDYILCNNTGYYLLCLKLEMGNDTLYIGAPVVTYTGYYALVNGGSKINLTEGAGDEYHKENYSASLVGTPLKAKDRVDFYGLFEYDGEEVGMALKSNIFPNPDDDGNKIENNLKPVTPGGTDFTVQCDTEGTLYFNVNNDDTFGFWLTDGPAILEGYWLQVDGVNVAQFTYDKKEGDFDQYFTSFEVEAGETISIYDAAGKTTFTVKFNSASQGFVDNGGVITCTKSGTYDFYLKLLYGADEIYIGEHVEMKTYTITFSDSWIFDANAKIFAWVWSESKWVECSRVGTTNAVTLQLAADSTGFTFVRADSSKTASTVGWPPDGSWNQSPDLNATSGVYTYDCQWIQPK